jgi:hypothetical protein
LADFTFQHRDVIVGFNFPECFTLQTRLRQIVNGYGFMPWKPTTGNRYL